MLTHEVANFNLWNKTIIFVNKTELVLSTAIIKRILKMRSNYFTIRTTIQ